MATYWHIAWDQYQPGQPLRCRADLGDEVPWKWDDDAPESFDEEVVCLFPDTPRGRTEADWLWFEHKAYHLLRIDVPEGIEMETVDEGYPAIRGEIPAAWITLIRTGFAEGIVTQLGDKY